MTLSAEIYHTILHSLESRLVCCYGQWAAEANAAIKCSPGHSARCPPRPLIIRANRVTNEAYEYLTVASLPLTHTHARPHLMSPPPTAPKRIRHANSRLRL